MPAFAFSGSNDTSKSKLKSLPPDETHLKLQPMPLPVGLELRERRPRHREEGDIAVGQVDVDPVEVVGPEGAALAPFLPVGGEHEVVDHQLTPTPEQIRQGLLAAGAVEDVRLGDLLPRQLAALRLSSSRSLVNSFSFCMNATRSVTHCSWETTRGCWTGVT